MAHSHTLHVGVVLQVLEPLVSLSRSFMTQHSTALGLGDSNSLNGHHICDMELVHLVLRIQKRKTFRQLGLLPSSGGATLAQATELSSCRPIFHQEREVGVQFKNLATVFPTVDEQTHSLTAGVPRQIKCMELLGGHVQTWHFNYV
jgi:hypothetical protein